MPSDSQSRADQGSACAAHQLGAIDPARNVWAGEHHSLWTRSALDRMASRGVDRGSHGDLPIEGCVRYGIISRQDRGIGSLITVHAV